MYPGIFHGCIGVGDMKEFQVVKLQDTIKEGRSFSGKKKLTVFLSDGSFRTIYFCEVMLRR